MRRIDISISLVAILGILLFNACEEVPPEIDYSQPVSGDTTIPIPTDTTYITTPEAPQPKVVMFEEFTGVKCTNCPEAHDLLNSILAANKGKIISSGLHSGHLAIPYNDGTHLSKNDFRIPAAASIAGHFQMAGQPQGMVDRVLFNGEPNIVLFQGSWGERATSRLNVPVSANVYVETYYSETTKTLYAAVTVKLLENITSPLNLTVGLTEDSIIDVQGSRNTVDYPPKGIIDEYTHRHTARAMFTSWHGIPFPAPDQKAGRVVTKRFAISFEGKNWDPSKCYVYAFVHYSGTPSEEILQAAEAHVK